MSLCNYNDIRAEGNLPSDLPESTLTPHLNGAETRLRSILSDDYYDEVEAEATTETRRKELTRAEAMMALYFALPVLNMKVGPKGGIVTATGFGETKNSFLTIDQVEKLSQRFYEKAMELISKYDQSYEDADADEDVTILEGTVDWIAV